MKKIYSLCFLVLLVSGVVIAQPAVKTLIYVGGTAETASAEDQVMIDSLLNWVENVVYLGASSFNSADPETLYTDVDGVIISESIDSKTVPNFGQTQDYPVPCIAMEGVFGVPDDTQKWPLLYEDGGIWGYGAPEEVDIQWRIVYNEHYITEKFNVDDEIYYAETPSRGVPYIHGIEPDHIILATAVRTDGGDQVGFNQDDAIACAYIYDPAIIYMNVSNLYFPEATDEFWDIMKRSAQFLFDFIPVGIDRVLSEEINLSVYPNPATREAAISFNMEEGKNISLNLISVMGGRIGNLYNGVSSSGDNNIMLNTSRYPAGLYFVELEADGKVAYSKFVLK